MRTPYYSDHPLLYMQNIVRAHRVGASQGAVEVRRELSRQLAPCVGERRGRGAHAPGGRGAVVHLLEPRLESEASNPGLMARNTFKNC